MALLHALAQRSRNGLLIKTYTNSGTAYAAGGMVNGSTHTTASDRYDIANDVITSVNLLSTAQSCMAGLSNTTTMIAAGGLTYSGQMNTTFKFTFATDASVAGTNLGYARQSAGGFGNATFGIVAGGGATNPTSVTEKYTYANDSVATATALTVKRDSNTGLSNQAIGFAVAGYDGANYLSSIDEYDLSTDAVVAATIAASVAHVQSEGGGNGDKGAAMGGSYNNGGVNIANVDVINYTNRTLSAGVALSAAKSAGGGAGSQSYTYQFGNNGGVSGGSSSYIDKYNLTTNAFEIAKASLSVSRAVTAAASNTQNGLAQAASPAGGVGKASGISYFSGGATGPRSALTFKYNTANDACTYGANLQTAKYAMGGLSSPSNGYLENGYTTVSLLQSERYNYASDTTTLLSATIGVANDDQAGLTNPSFGILTGGDSGIADSTNLQSYKRTYATEAVTAATSMLNVHDNVAVAFGNQSAGFVASGRTNANSMPNTTTDKYTYATDTVAASSPILTARSSTMSTGTATEGLVMGGYTGNLYGYLSECELFGYASETYVTTTSLPPFAIPNSGNVGGLYGATSGGDGNVGLVCGGDDSATSGMPYVTKYAYPTKVWTSGTQLPGGEKLYAATGFGPTAGGLQ